MPERKQLRVDAVLERTALAYQEQAPAHPPALAPLFERWQPDRRHN
jgi:hypothetical protein